MATTAPPPPEAEKPPISFPARAIGVFMSPTETFADIARRPSAAWIAPLLLLTIFAVGTSTIMFKRIGIGNIIRNEMMKNQRIADMPAEQRERIIESSLAFGKYTSYIAPVFGPIVILLVISGVLALMANFVLGGEAKYPTLMATTAYGMLPGLVTSILTVVTVLLKDPGDIDIRNPVISNLALLFDPTSHKALHRLGSSIDLFSFWQIALLAVGVAAAARFSFKKGLVAVGVPWAIWVLGAAGISSLF